MSLSLPKPERTPRKPKKRPRKQRKTSRAKLVREADALWAKIVKRAGVCDFSSAGLFPELYPHECWGSLQAMHGISRRYHGTRWSLMNGFAGCQRTHWRYSVRVQEWDSFLISAWGLNVFEEMWYHALNGSKPDMAEVLEKLREESS